MLISLRKGACVLAVAVTSMATSVQADNHTVLIMDGGYFPDIVYVNRGDNIIFTNNSESEHTVGGPEGSWISDPIPVDGTYRLNINNQMAQTFSGQGANDLLMEGSFSYEEAPVTE
ncbi:MAG: hypothetical protein WA790_02125 [Sulfitobacter sp.]